MRRTDKMRSCLIFGLLLGVVTVVYCDGPAWSSPTTSADCTDVYPGSKEYWHCDWSANSGPFNNYFQSYPFPNTESSYSSYITNMPSAVYGLMENTMDLMTQCNGYFKHLQASSWLDIPYVCPDLASSLTWYHDLFGSDHRLTLSEWSCQNIQNLFCNAVSKNQNGGQTESSSSYPQWTNTPSPSSSAYSQWTMTPSPSSWSYPQWTNTPSPSSSSYSQWTMTPSQPIATVEPLLNPLAHFMAHYDYNSYRTNNPYTRYPTNPTRSRTYMIQFVTSMYDCQNAISNFVALIDCSVVSSLFGNLGYPDYSSSMQYQNAYLRWAREDYGELCRTVVDHVYKGFSEKIGQSVQIIPASASPRPFCSMGPSTMLPSTSITTQHTTRIGSHPYTTPYPYHKTTIHPLPRTTNPRFPWFVKTTTPPGPDSDSDFDNMLSEWLIVVLSVVGVIGFLGFCALLFYLIYTMYTYTKEPASENTPTAIYVNDGVQVALPDTNDKVKSPPTPPPAYDRYNEKKAIEIA